VVGLVLVLAVVLLILLVTRVATVVLALTGMSTESARFQARSALTGVGFTTSEAESVVNHPVRRRVVLVLMLLGSAGVVTALASLVISFGGGASSGERVTRGLVLVGGLTLVLLLARSRTFDRLLGRVVTRVLRARGLDVADYAGLLRLSGGFTVGELEVEEGDWVANRTLRELRLRDEGVIVLGVSRHGGDYLGAPGPDTRIQAGDTLVLYGRGERLEELDERRGGRLGDAAHREAVLPEREPSAAGDLR
jgi:TrkA-C domain